MSLLNVTNSVSPFNLTNSVASAQRVCHPLNKSSKHHELHESTRHELDESSTFHELNDPSKHHQLNASFQFHELHGSPQCHELQVQARDGYTKSAIDKFLEKGQLHMALQFAGADVEYHFYLVTALIRLGNYSQVCMKCVCLHDVCM